MSWRPDKIMVVDLEMTCWDGPVPEGEQRDIIEIGISVWDTGTNEVSRPVSYPVRPERSTVSAYCTSLTGLTQRQVRRAMPFSQVCHVLQSRWGSRGKAWAAFGDDASAFQKQCSEYKVRYPFGPRYYDVSQLFTVMRGERRGLAGVVSSLGFEFDGTPHRAGDDAYNTALVLRALLRPGAPEASSDAGCPDCESELPLERAESVPDFDTHDTDG
jgi:inhibitor of KinA sporulation pathway (predicted exonuclease)